MEPQTVVAALSIVASVLLAIYTASKEAQRRLDVEVAAERNRRLLAAEDEIRGLRDRVVKQETLMGGQMRMMEKVQEQMVPRKEWETRHDRTDEMLGDILKELRRAPSQVDPIERDDRRRPLPR